MTQRLVVGIDGSDESAVALRWAMEEARRREFSVELVHALSIPVVSDAYGMVMTRPDVDELTAYSEELLRAAEAAARAQTDAVEVSTRLACGPPAAVLLELSDGSAGLVVGSRGLGAISGRMLGSVSIRVSVKATCPVYVIPPAFSGEEAAGAPVVVGVDGSPHGDAALRLALDDALCRDTTLRLVTAYRAPWVGSAPDADVAQQGAAAERVHAEQAAHEALERVRRPEHAALGVEVQVMECQPAEAMIRAGREAVLTCVGSRGRSAISRALLGSVSRAVLQEAIRPVAVVHAPKDGAADQS